MNRALIIVAVIVVIGVGVWLGTFNFLIYRWEEVSVGYPNSVTLSWNVPRLGQKWKVNPNDDRFIQKDLKKHHSAFIADIWASVNKHELDMMITCRIVKPKQSLEGLARTDCFGLRGRPPGSRSRVKSLPRLGAGARVLRVDEPAYPNDGTYQERVYVKRAGEPYVYILWHYSYAEMKMSAKDKDTIRRIMMSFHAQ